MEEDAEDGSGVPSLKPKGGRRDRARGARVKMAVARVGGAEDLAKLANVPYGTITNYTGGGEMKLSNAVAIADATGVRLEWLATGEGAMLRAAPDAPQSEAQPVSGKRARLQASARARKGVAEPSPAREDATSLGLTWSVNLDRLARAYEMALQGIVVLPGRAPDPKRLLQVMLLIYDEMADAEAASESAPTPD
ncbi:helix-turn-helix domain containing protein [Roseomonas sp. HJA6]|uniref:Helix-turn-helix domain containing protein n=1 Tax=Roseomonas alba TaxID=2846776 RepID=A0ABS7ACD0_9PROT|nr:helix-turn-helix domain-containing protein [Neoroseomonas alba]MBW6399955.1 helix-turn-helix domain containing protein [Neoroseomonas alba]